MTSVDTTFGRRKDIFNCLKDSSKRMAFINIKAIECTRKRNLSKKSIGFVASIDEPLAHQVSYRLEQNQSKANFYPAKGRTMASEYLFQHGNFLISQNSGRVIELTNLHQFRTYQGLLCGYPRKLTNEWHLENDLESCLKVYPFDCKPVLIPPKITPKPDYPGVKNPEGLGLPCEVLPLITSYGLFDSTPTIRDEGCNSALVVVWYQDLFGPPTDPETLAYLREIDWDNRAVDYMW